MEASDRMRPIIILPPDAMSVEDIKKLEDNQICVVVAKAPGAVKFLDPIPASSSRTQIETAAIELSRKILNKGFWTNETTRDNMARCFVDILIQGTRLSLEPTQSETQAQIFDYEKAEEIRRLAREEAKAEHRKKQQEKAARRPAQPQIPNATAPPPVKP